MQTPGHRNKFSDCQKAKAWFAVLSIEDVKTSWNSKMELLMGVYWLGECSCQWLINPQYRYHRPLFMILDKWTIVKYLMEVLRPVRYWTLCMSNQHTITLHPIITVYNDMSVHIDGMMWELAKKRTAWKENVLFAVKCERQMLSKYYPTVTPTSGLHLD